MMTTSVSVMVCFRRWPLLQELLIDVGIVIPGWSEGRTRPGISRFRVRAKTRAPERRCNISAPPPILIEDAVISTALSDDVVPHPPHCPPRCRMLYPTLPAPLPESRRRYQPDSSRSLHDFTGSVRCHGTAFRFPN